MSVDQHEPTGAMAVTGRGQRAEQHGTVAADQQWQSVAVVTRGHRFTGSDNETRQSCLMQKA